MSVTELDEARERVAAEQNGDDPYAEDDQGDLFPQGSFEGDPKLTFAKLMKANRPVEVTAALTAAKVPVRDGRLLNPDKTVQVLVTVLPQKAELVYKRNLDTGPEVISYEVRQPLRTIYVEDARGYYSREQVLEFFNQLGVPASSDRVAELLGDA